MSRPSGGGVEDDTRNLIEGIPDCTPPSVGGGVGGSKMLKYPI